MRKKKIISTTNYRHKIIVREFQKYLSVKGKNIFFDTEAQHTLRPYHISNLCKRNYFFSIIAIAVSHIKFIYQILFSIYIATLYFGLFIRNNIYMYIKCICMYVLFEIICIC